MAIGIKDLIEGELKSMNDTELENVKREIRSKIGAICQKQLARKKLDEEIATLKKEMLELKATEVVIGDL